MQVDAAVFAVFLFPRAPRGDFYLNQKFQKLKMKQKRMLKK